MKKTLLLFLFSFLITASSIAQHCALASYPITPVSFGQPGLQPLPEDLPCTVIGQPVSDTIYFQNFTTVQTFTLDSLKIDSINNLPPGLCWVMDHANNTYSSGQAGTIYLSGTPTGPPGQYKIDIIVNAYLSGLTLTNLNAEAATGMRYYVRARCAAAACTPLDTNSPYPSFIPYTSCPGPPPALITALGPDSICPGGSVTLSASQGASYSYRWSTGATTDSITVSAAGPYTVTVYNGTDSTVSSPAAVTILSAPSAVLTPAGTVPLCQGGDSVTLSAAAGYSYDWSTSAHTRSITLATPGTYSLTVTDSHNCTAVSIPDTVVSELPPPAVIIKNGFVLTAGSGTGYSYQWYWNGTLISGDTTESITATADGSYTVLVTNKYGCHALSTATPVNNVGIHDISGDAAVRLYPNPTEGILTLDAPAMTGGEYELRDAWGRMIRRSTIIADKMPIDMSREADGIYYMTVIHELTTETIRFVLMK